MSTDVKVEIELEARRIEEDALFSYKGHYNSAVPWTRWSRLLASAAALGSALAAVAVLKNWSATISVSSAAIATIAGAINASMQPHGLADRHQRAGDRYLSIRNRARILRKIQMLTPGESAESLLAEIRTLSLALDQAREGAPVVSRRAYCEAKRDIEVDGVSEYKADKISRMVDSG